MSLRDDDIKLTEDQKDELLKAFKLFEKTGKGKIAVRDFGAFLRSLGWNPSESDIEEARNELDIGAKGTIAYGDIEKYIARKSTMLDGFQEEDDIVTAFQALDKNGNGKIERKEFRHFMTTMGDRMSQEEVEELMDAVGGDGEDYIYCKELIRAMNTTT